MKEEYRKEPQRFEETIDIFYLFNNIWRGIRQFYWIFLIIVSISTTVGYYYAKKSYQPNYEAYASFAVDAGTVSTYSSSYYNSTTIKQLSATFPYILTSGALRQIVMDDLGLEEMNVNITASAVEETNLFRIETSGRDPDLVYEVLESVIKNYPEVAEYIIGSTKLVMVDDSGVPKEPSNQPNLKRMALSGCMAGIVLSGILLVCYALTRNTICGDEDVKKIMQIKNLGTLPTVKMKKRRKDKGMEISLLNQKLSPSFMEGVRTLRIRLDAELLEISAKTVLVNSAIQGEGKTIIAVNLALSRAIRGEKVLLIDADLRNPSVSQVLHLDTNKKEIADVLSGKLSWKSALISEEETGLQVLAGTYRCDNSVKLIESIYMEQLLEEAKEQFDCVIVDAPPCTVLSDAIILAKKLESVVMVIRYDYARVSQILKGSESLADTGISMIGYVLNAIESGIRGYGYYAYRYGYYHRRYGYYSTDNRNVELHKKSTSEEK